LKKSLFGPNFVLSLKVCDKRVKLIACLVDMRLAYVFPSLYRGSLQLLGCVWHSFANLVVQHGPTVRWQGTFWQVFFISSHTLWLEMTRRSLVPDFGRKGTRSSLLKALLTTFISCFDTFWTVSEAAFLAARVEGILPLVLCSFLAIFSGFLPLFGPLLLPELSISTQPGAGALSSPQYGIGRATEGVRGRKMAVYNRKKVI
jgi:hypothetical protein